MALSLSKRPSRVNRDNGCGIRTDLREQRRRLQRVAEGDPNSGPVRSAIGEVGDFTPGVSVSQVNANTDPEIAEDFKRLAGKSWRCDNMTLSTAEGTQLGGCVFLVFICEHKL